MKYILIGYAIGIILFGIAYTQPTYAQTELFQDPSFEEIPNSTWVGSEFGNEQTSTLQRTGTSSWAIWSGRTKVFGIWLYYQGNIYQPIYNLPAGEYQVSTWYYPTANSEISIEGCEYTPPKEEEEELESESIELENCADLSEKWTTIVSSTVSSSTEWQYIQGTFKTHGLEETYLKFKDTAYNNPKRIYLDDASVIRIQQPHTSIFYITTIIFIFIITCLLVRSF